MTFPYDGYENRGGATVAPRRFSLAWWIVIVTLGGVLGLFAPAFAQALASRLDLPAWIAYPTLALAGALMGLVLGIAQSGALHGTALGVSRAGWSLGTMAASLTAWALGVLPATLEGSGAPLELDGPRIMAAVAVGVVVLVLAVPTLQWLLLRRVARGAWLWIPFSVLGVALGLALAWVVRELFDPSTPDAALAGSIAMAAALALGYATVTGLALRMMRARSFFDEQQAQWAQEA